MGLDLSKSGAASQQADDMSGNATENALVEVRPYDISADRDRMNRDLTGSEEVDRLVSQIELDRLDTIVSFGASAAQEIAKVSDTVLNSMSMDRLDESGEMLSALTKIMDKFDLDEIRKEPGVLSRLFGSARKQLDRILDKYHTMGDEVDKIYVRLKQYEAELEQANRNLETMFEANVGYYHELVKYILAGEQGCRELEAHIARRRADLESTGDNAVRFDLAGLDQALQMLEQRTQDLRTAEMVAIQAIPMLKTMAFSNMNLVRKINSAFIITLPVFKQALAQAIMLKRQKIQADAMAALDQRTNEMLIKNAKNTMTQAKLTTQMASSSSIRADTLETTWRTIVSGIEETKKIQESAKAQRQQDQAKLEAIKQDFLARCNTPGK